jgi:hypothetical protein
MPEIKYSKEIPPIYYRCREKFGVDWDTGVIFTYGDTIYCKKDLDAEMKVHEATHVKQQQDMGAEVWWDMYINDPAFRLTQEVEAYRNQYKFLQAHIKDRNRLFKEKHKILMHLSSSMYGNMVTYSQAMNIL